VQRRHCGNIKRETSCLDVACFWEGQTRQKNGPALGGLIGMACGMRQNGIAIILLSAIMLFASGCVAEPGLDKKKFAELNRAAQDLKAAIRAGMRCEFPDMVLQRLASGTTALKDKTTSKTEHDLLSAYSHLLTICKDGLLLCQSRTHLSNFQFVPKGRIYVTQELDPLIEKYDLPTEKHLYKPTGKYWRSISEDSITVIWESAEDEIKIIENMVNYN
jgi:hypothetical protein